MIRRVRLRNWRSHERTELEFEDGINVIVGRMGAGKSSIFDAISFALFGTFPALQSRKLTLDMVIMNRGKVKDEAEVEVEFEIGGHSYSVRRVVKKGRGVVTSELRKDGKLIEYPQTRKVTDTVEEILGMSYDTFSRAVYSVQNQIDRLISLPPSERRKQMDELLGMDKFDKAVETARRMANQFRKEAEMLKVQAAEIRRRDPEKRIAELKNAIEESRKELENLAAEVDKAEKEAADLRRAVEEEEEKRRRHAQLSHSISLIERQIREMERRVSSLPEIEISDAEMKLRATEEEIKAGEERSKEMARHLRALLQELKVAEEQERRRKELEEALREIEKELESLPEVDAESLRREMEEKMSEAKSLRSLANEERERLKGIRDSSICPVCERPLTDEHRAEIEERKRKRIEELEKKAKDLEDEALSLRRRAKMAEEAAIRRSRLQARREEMLRQIPKERTDIEGIRRKAEEVEAELEKMEAGLKVLRQRKEEMLRLLEAGKRRKEAEERLKDLQQKREEMEREMASISLRQDYEEMKKAYRSASMRLASLLERRKGIKERIAMLEDSLKDAESMLESIRKFEERIGFLDFAIYRLTGYAEHLKAKQEEIRREASEAMNAFMEEIWQDLYPYEDFTSIRLTEAYEMELFDGEKWVKIEGIASGGERTLAALTLRLAVSLLLTKDLRFLLLDEPTHNMDDSAISLFSEVLRTRIGDFVSQIIIITHEERLENAATSRFYRLDKKGFSTVVA